MKCYAVNIMTLKGEYKSVYLGSDLAEAKKINREHKNSLANEESMKKKDCIAVFFFPKPYSKRVSGQARHMHALDRAKKVSAREESKSEPVKKAPTKKKSSK